MGSSGCRRYSAARFVSGSRNFVRKRIPFLGADAIERGAHRHAVARGGVDVGFFQRRQCRVAGTDRGLQQQSGHDRQFEAHRFGLAQVDLRRLAAPDDVQQAWPVHAFRNGGDFFHGLRRLDERHVGAGGEGGVGAGDGFLEADHRARIGARDDQEVRIVAAGGGGADLREPVLARHDFLVIQMAAALWRDLILDVDARDTGALVVPHRAHDIEFVAVAGVGVGDDRNLHRARHAGGVGDHLGLGEQAEIRIAVRDGRAGAGHVDRGKSSLRDELRGQPVIGARRDHHAWRTQQRA